MDLEKNVTKIHIAVFFNENPDAFKLAFALKETFSTMFPNGPQMIPLPPDAPEDAPRCVFQNEAGSANLNFSLSRMDMDNSLKVEAPWRNHIEIVEMAFVAICKQCNIGIKRLGIVVQSLIDDELIQTTSEKVSVLDFKQSEEKNIAWVTHELVDDSIKLNVNTNIQIHTNNPKELGTLTLDVNTSVDSILPQVDKDLLTLVGTMLDKIQEKMKNVF